MVFPGLQTLVSTVQNIVQAVSALATFLRQALNNVPPRTVMGNPGTTDGQLFAMTALQVSQLLLTTGAEVTLLDDTTVTPDFAAGTNFVLQLTTVIGATRLLGNPDGAVVGEVGYIRMVQSATGGEAVTFDTQYQAAGGVASLTPTTTANAVNLFIYNVVAGPTIVLSVLPDVRH